MRGRLLGLQGALCDLEVHQFRPCREELGVEFSLLGLESKLAVLAWDFSWLQPGLSEHRVMNQSHPRTRVQVSSLS